MLFFFYDTETTGIPKFDMPSEDPAQPHLVQVAAGLVDSTSRAKVAGIDLIIRPNGWIIPDESAAVHGITTEIALARGIDEAVAITALYQLWLLADRRIAHSQHFDARIIRTALLRSLGESPADRWKAGNSECTANLARPIMQVAPSEKMQQAGMKMSKTPSLSEAVLYFTGHPLENAHNAGPDLDGCAAVYWAIQDGVRERVPLQAVAA